MILKVKLAQFFSADKPVMQPIAGKKAGDDCQIKPNDEDIFDYVIH